MTRVQKEWMRGAGPLAVLKMLERREMYGYELALALDRQSDGVLAMGHSTLYPVLYKLEERGLVSSSTRTANRRSRKYYRVTAAGHAWLEVHHAEWNELVSAMGRLGLA